MYCKDPILELGQGNTGIDKERQPELQSQRDLLSPVRLARLARRQLDLGSHDFQIILDLLVRTKVQLLGLAIHVRLIPRLQTL